jgi:hypothetical protein
MEAGATLGLAWHLPVAKPETRGRPVSEGRRGRCVPLGVDVVRLPFVLAATSGVLGRHLDDDEREPVWVADGHLNQTPGL